MKTLKLKIKKIYIPVRTTGLFAAAIDQWRGLSWRFDLGPSLPDSALGLTTHSKALSQVCVTPY